MTEIATFSASHTGLAVFAILILMRCGLVWFTGSVVVGLLVAGKLNGFGNLAAAMDQMSMATLARLLQSL